MNIPLVAGVLVVIFGGYMLRHAIVSYRTAVASLTWPTTNGQVTEVRLWGLRNIDGKMKDANNLIVAYHYKIDNVSYSGKSVTFYTLVYPETIALAKRYSATPDVKVYYNPANVSKSVLVPGPNPNKPYSDLILSCVAVVTGIAVMVFAWLGVIG